MLICFAELSVHCIKMSSLISKLKFLIPKRNTASNRFYRFGIKVGIAAGAVYYLNEQGVWKDSEETQKIYGKLNTIASPYVKQVTEQLPFEVSTKNLLELYLKCSI